MSNTLIGLIWEDLDRVVDQLMDDDLEWESKRDKVRAQGRAEGLSYALAILLHSPRKPDINEIREEAMERWEERQAAASQTTSSET